MVTYTSITQAGPDLFDDQTYKTIPITQTSYRGKWKLPGVLAKVAKKHFTGKYGIRAILVPKELYQRTKKYAAKKSTKKAAKKSTKKKTKKIPVREIIELIQRQITSLFLKLDKLYDKEKIDQTDIVEVTGRLNAIEILNKKLKK